MKNMRKLMRNLSKMLDWKTVLYVWVLIHAVVLWIGGLVMALATANWWWLLLWLPCIACVGHLAGGL